MGDAAGVDGVVMCPICYRSERDLQRFVGLISYFSFSHVVAKSARPVEAPIVASDVTDILSCNMQTSICLLVAANVSCSVQFNWSHFGPTVQTAAEDKMGSIHAAEFSSVGDETDSEWPNVGGFHITAFHLRLSHMYMMTKWFVEGRLQQ